MTLKFGPTDQDAITFAHIWGAFMAGETALRGMMQIRAANRVIDAFESISEEIRREGAPSARRLRQGGAELELREEDLGLLRRVVREVLIDGPADEHARQSWRRLLSAPEAARVADLLGIEE